MRQAGLDGVELVASHGYLLGQFLNPNTNRQNAAFGGLRAGRMRFLQEAIAATRRGAGAGMVLGVRPAGIDAEDAYFQHTLSGESVVLEAIDTLVTALGHTPNTQLAKALNELGILHHVIGDRLSPRTVEEAILEGLRVRATI